MLIVDEAKEFLRIDSDSEDTTIDALVKASKAYLKNAGITEPIDTEHEQIELYKLAQKLLITHWFENREIVGKADKLAFSLNCILPQLKYCGGDTV